MIDINKLTLGELKEINRLFNLNNNSEPKKEDMRYVIVRTYSAGVFAGNIESRKDREIVLRNARRIWYWEGAASLSQLAMQGTSKPDKCKFPCEMDRIEILEAIEIIDCTEIAEKSIKGVVIWNQ